MTMTDQMPAQDSEMAVVSADALGTIVRGEVDMQVATAKKYPRSIQRFKSLAMSMATMNQETAEGCMYAVPRDGKTIEGPSIRLAEIVSSAWGNIRQQSRIISIGQEFVTAQGVCWDMETNNAISVEVQRRITGKTGRRYSADMIVTTANAASAIALRNATFKVVPGVYVKEILDAARKVAIGDVKTLVARRTAAVQNFAKMGVSSELLLKKLDKPSVDDLGLEEVHALRTMFFALRDGEADIDEMFPELKGGTPKDDDRKPGAQTAGNLAAELKGAAGLSAGTAPKLGEGENLPKPVSEAEAEALIQAAAKKTAEKQGTTSAPPADTTTAAASGSTPTSAAGIDLTDWSAFSAYTEKLAVERHMQPDQYDELLSKELLRVGKVGKGRQTDKAWREHFVTLITNWTQPKQD